MSNHFDTTGFVVSMGSFLTDHQVASLLKLSTAWMRKQRHLRKTGKPHILTVDPVLIGKIPRYRSEDIKNWLDNL